MADFISPSMRAAGSDLTIAISPLGLVELSDEEFEVHGPRLNRYAQAWAFYLGHQWAYRRQAGEPQITFNYSRALSDWLVNFTFGKGVNFVVDRQFQHIVPALLDRMWNVDNDKEQTLWEIGNQGSVQGDAFVKVAYEPAWTDPAGMTHPGRVRILPINASFCLSQDTEILTRRGWLTYDQLTLEDEAASLDPATHEIVWSSIEHVNVFDWDGPLARWQNERFDVMSTPDHRWLTRDGRGKERIRRTEDLHDLKSNGMRLVTAGGQSHLFAKEATYDDNLIQLAAWFVTEGHWHQNGAPMFTQSFKKYPENAAEIAALLWRWQASHYIYEGKADQWYAPNLKRMMLDMVGPDKRFGIDFLTKLTVEQAGVFFDTLIKADGNIRKDANTTTFAQSDPGRVDDFQTLCMMLGKRTHVRWRQRKIGRLCADITVYGNDTVNLTNLRRTEEHYTGKVWCPTTGTGMWIARRKGITFHTGNCFPEWHPHDRARMVRFKLKYRFWATSPEGTRQVNTYVEIITDDYIEEYVNDELIDRRPNVLGEIPVVHISNKLASASPWGLSDIIDVLSLNREYNEKATDISDIINYHTAPVTVVTGAKVSNLEQGANKIWGFPNKDAKVQNLSGGTEALPQALEYLNLIKVGMHEMTGVPETALGQAQPISNTSGVALAIQFQPTMMAYDQKRTQYSAGLRKINAIALKTLLIFEPDKCVYNPDSDGVYEEGLPLEIDPLDPQIYNIQCSWSPPLPVDTLIKLNEIQLKLALGLESRRGALEDLQEDFPDEKLQELFDEKVEDAKQDAALRVVRAYIDAAIIQLTGVIPEGTETVTPPGAPDANGNSAPGQMDALPKLPGMNAIVKQMAGLGNDLISEITTQAYGMKLPQRRVVDNTNSNQSND